MEDPLDPSLSADELIYEMRKCSSVKLPIYQARLRNLLMKKKKSKAATARRRALRTSSQTKSEVSGQVAESSRQVRSASRSEEVPEDKCGCKKRKRKRSCAPKKKKRSCRPRRKRSCRPRRKRSCRPKSRRCRSRSRSRKRRCRK